MKTTHQIIRDRLKVPLRDEPTNLTMAELSKTEWSSEFESLMRNRLIMGALRYGRMVENRDKGYRRIEAAIEKLKSYLQIGNDELLVDTANYLLLEFVNGTHPSKHFTATDDKHHCKI